MNNRGFTVSIPVLLAFTLFVLPAPEGLSSQAWNLFGIFAGTILLLMLQGLPEPSAVLVGVTAAGLLVVPLEDILVGFTDQIVWLVVVAIIMSIGFNKSRLSRRIGFLMIGAFGKSSLRLGYVFSFMDLLLATFVPAAPARTGGLVYPMCHGVFKAVNSTPRENPRRLGSYLTVLLCMVSMTTGSIFMTGMAPNLLNAKLASQLVGVQISWPLWTIGAAPSFIVFLLIPVVVYRLHLPEMHSVEHIRQVARIELKAMGPMHWKEIVVAATFLTALILWATSGMTKMNITIVAFLGTVILLLCNVIQWEDIAESKEAWSTLVWFGGIIGLCSALDKLGFFKWLTVLLKSALPLGGLGLFPSLLIIALLAIVPHYLFPSLTGYVAIFSPVLFGFIVATNIPHYPAVLLACYLMVISSTLTHYGNGLGPMIVATGYVDKRIVWKLGLVVTSLAATIYLTVGLLYWKLIGLY